MRRPPRDLRNVEAGVHRGRRWSAGVDGLALHSPRCSPESTTRDHVWRTGAARGVHDYPIDVDAPGGKAHDLGRCPATTTAERNPRRRPARRPVASHVREGGPGPVGVRVGEVSSRSSHCGRSQGLAASSGITLMTRLRGSAATSSSVPCNASPTCRKNRCLAQPVRCQASTYAALRASPGRGRTENANPEVPRAPASRPGPVVTRGGVGRALASPDPGRYDGWETDSDLAKCTGRGLPGTRMWRFAFRDAGSTLDRRENRSRG
jgi:hypothetical protein